MGTWWQRGLTWVKLFKFNSWNNSLRTWRINQSISIPSVQTNLAQLVQRLASLKTNLPRLQSNLGNLPPRLIQLPASPASLKIHLVNLSSSTAKLPTRLACLPEHLESLSCHLPRLPAHLACLPIHLARLKSYIFTISRCFCYFQRFWGICDACEKSGLRFRRPLALAFSELRDSARRHCSAEVHQRLKSCRHNRALDVRPNRPC
jgi:hypothetical protein